MALFITVTFGRGERRRWNPFTVTLSPLYSYIFSPLQLRFLPFTVTFSPLLQLHFPPFTVFTTVIPLQLHCHPSAVTITPVYSYFFFHPRFSRQTAQELTLYLVYLVQSIAALTVERKEGWKHWTTLSASKCDPPERVRSSLGDTTSIASICALEVRPTSYPHEYNHAFLR